MKATFREPHLRSSSRRPPEVEPQVAFHDQFSNRLRDMFDGWKPSALTFHNRDSLTRDCTSTPKLFVSSNEELMKSLRSLERCTELNDDTVEEWASVLDAVERKLAAEMQEQQHNDLPKSPEGDVHHDEQRWDVPPPDEASPPAATRTVDEKMVGERDKAAVPEGKSVRHIQPDDSHRTSHTADADVSSRAEWFQNYMGWMRYYQYCAAVQQWSQHHENTTANHAKHRDRSDECNSAVQPPEETCLPANYSSCSNLQDCAEEVHSFGYHQAVPQRSLHSGGEAGYHQESRSPNRSWLYGFADDEVAQRSLREQRNEGATAPNPLSTTFRTMEMMYRNSNQVSESVQQRSVYQKKREALEKLKRSDKRWRYN